MLIFLALFFLFVLAIYAVFIYTLQTTLSLIAPSRRRMEPGMVWLLLVPIFHLIWLFVVVRRVSDSIQAEFSARGLPTEPQPTYNIGLAFSILFVASTIGNRLIYVPHLDTALSLAVLICWIIYWTKIAAYKKRLQDLPPDVPSDSLTFGREED